jgi:hypothetical protein
MKDALDLAFLRRLRFVVHQGAHKIQAHAQEKTSGERRTDFPRR